MVIESRGALSGMYMNVSDSYYNVVSDSLRCFVLEGRLSAPTFPKIVCYQHIQTVELVVEEDEEAALLADA